MPVLGKTTNWLLQKKYKNHLAEKPGAGLALGMASSWAPTLAPGGSAVRKAVPSFLEVGYSLF